MSLRHAILGFLSVRPMTGYDLKRAFDGSVALFWAADQAQIYRTLAGLEEGGLVRTERVEQRVRPDRKVHHLSPAGRAELLAWFAAPTPPAVRREPFLVKLFFVQEVDPAALDALLTAELAAAEAELAALTAVAGELLAIPSGPVGPALTLWSGLAAGRAWRDWLREARAATAAGALAWEPVRAALARATGP